MRNWKIVALATAVSAGIALLASCGGSSDSNSSGATKSARAAAPLTAQALNVATTGLQVRGIAGSHRAVAAASTTSVSAPEQGLNAAVARFQRSANTKAINARATTAQGVMPPTPTCTTGTVTVTGDTRVYENCEYTDGDMKIFEDGTITITSVESADGITFTLEAGTAQKPYVYRQSMMMSGAMAMPVFEMSIMGNVKGTNTGLLCNSIDNNIGYPNSTMNMDGEFRIKGYSAGVATHDFMLKATDLSEVMIAKLGSDCMLTDVTITENGAIEWTDHLNNVNNMSMTATNLVMHSVTSMDTAAQQKTTRTTLTGTMDVKSSCFTGSLTFATIEDIVQVVDDSEFDSCPIAGKLAISGSAVVTVRYTATGGVEIDNGSDGTVDQTFKSCEDANICS